MTNDELATIFNNIADLLEEQEENLYRIKAYRKAARALEKHPQAIETLVQRKEDLTLIPAIGKHLAATLEHIILTGEIPLPSAKPAQDYPTALLMKKRKPPVFRIYSIGYIIEKLRLRLLALPAVTKVECASDYRRKKEVVSDLEFIIVTSDASQTFAEFSSYTPIKYIIENNPTFITVQLKIGLRVTLRAVKPVTFGAELLRATGSSPHYQALQQWAAQKGFRLTEKGLFKDRKKVAGDSEEEIYSHLDLAFITPELREDRGEIQAASSGSLTKLIELSDIKGDLHSHTNETDGSFPLEAMVEAARKQGYAYLAITDHSQSLKITNGMDEKRLLKQIAQIDKLNASFTDFRILKSMEIDILEDGSLDLAEAVLKELDLTVCSVHSKFRLPLEQQTERIIRAMDNPYFSILGHATGRLLMHRPPYALDIEKILLAAKDRGCFVEVNAQPARLDINDVYCKQAKEIGVKVAISSDAHTTRGFQFMILGVNQARRGWLEAKDVINTYSLKQLLKMVKRK